jgi:hypothetical protein
LTLGLIFIHLLFIPAFSTHTKKERKKQRKREREKESKKERKKERDCSNFKCNKNVKLFQLL